MANGSKPTIINAAIIINSVPIPETDAYNANLSFLMLNHDATITPSEMNVMKNKYVRSKLMPMLPNETLYEYMIGNELIAIGNDSINDASPIPKRKELTVFFILFAFFKSVSVVI